MRQCCAVIGKSGKRCPGEGVVLFDLGQWICRKHERMYDRDRDFQVKDVWDA